MKEGRDYEYKLEENRNGSFICRIGLCGYNVIDIVLVAGGYFVCEYFLYGASAAASIPANIIQGVGGLVISIILYPILIAIPDINQMASPAKAQ